MLSKKILGVWEMRSWETVAEDRVVGYPLGEKASGFIAYDPTVFMSVIFQHPIVLAFQLMTPSKVIQRS